MTITPTPADATRSLAILKALRSRHSRTTNHRVAELSSPPGTGDAHRGYEASSWILHRLALTLPGIILMGGGLGLLALLPEDNAVGVVTFLVGALLACGALVLPVNATTSTRTESPKRKTPSSAEMDAHFTRRPAAPSEIIDTASWLAADGLPRSEAISWLFELHRPTRGQLEEALALHTQRMHRSPTEETTRTLRLLIAATAVHPWGVKTDRLRR